MVIIAHDSNNIARFLLTDSSGRLIVPITDGTTTAYIDPVANSLITSRAVHRRIELSNQWVTSHYFSAVAAAASAYIHLKVSATKNAHISVQVMSEAKVTFRLFENPTTTGDGTAITRTAINRQTPTASTMTTFHTPTSSADGTELEVGMLGAAGKFSVMGGSIEAAGYWFLKKSEQYLVKVTNNDAAAKDIVISISWHED